MTNSGEPGKVIVCFTAGFPQKPLPKNPAITKVEHFANNPGNVLGVSEASHPDGQECGRHNHRGMDELFYVTAGVGIVEAGEHEHLLEAGDSVLVPASVYHNLRGVGGEAADGQPFKVVCVAIRARGHEDDPEPWKGTE